MFNIWDFFTTVTYHRFRENNFDHTPKKKYKLRKLPVNFTKTGISKKIVAGTDQYSLEALKNNVRTKYGVGNFLPVFFCRNLFRSKVESSIRHIYFIFRRTVVWQKGEITKLPFTTLQLYKVKCNFHLIFHNKNSRFFSWRVRYLS